VESFPLTAANEALDALRSGKINGAAVLLLIMVKLTALLPLDIKTAEAGIEIFGGNAFDAAGGNYLSFVTESALTSAAGGVSS